MVIIVWLAKDDASVRIPPHIRFGNLSPNFLEPPIWLNHFWNTMVGWEPTIYLSIICDHQRLSKTLLIRISMCIEIMHATIKRMFIKSLHSKSIIYHLICLPMETSVVYVPTILKMSHAFVYNVVGVDNFS